MLEDRAMQRLAEMCGWQHPNLQQYRFARLYFCLDGDYMADKEEGGWQLTPAGYFTVIKVLKLYVSITAEDTWLAGSYREDADENDEGEGGTLEAAIDAALEEIL